MKWNEDMDSFSSSSRHRLPKSNSNSSVFSELYESFHGYLCNFTVHTGAGSYIYS